ncbi:hypothetical protein U1Q18_034002 [Sarracenia purpurea var. burkii]
MPSLPSPGKILRLELENFKSYKGPQTIGPFFNFTAIIGPNGAGKSNLMDAISFVLGVRTGQLRGSQLKDLIYAFDDREKEQRRRKAFVRLVYELGNGAKLEFTRSITSSGGSEYRIDGRVVNWDEYNAKLKSLGILVKARNFLVFQGDVESIASKNPRELTALIEQISGSDELKGDYENLEEQKARAEEKSTLIYQKKKTIVSERRQKKEQKEEAEKHIRLQDELKTLKKEHFLWQLWNIEKDIEKANEEVEAEKKSREELVQELTDYEREASIKKKVQAKYLKEIAQCEKKIAEKNSRLDKNQPELVKLKEEMSRISSKIRSSEKDLKKKKEERKKHADEIKKLQNDLHDLTKRLDVLNEKVQDGGEKLHLADSQLDTYHRMLEYEQKRDMDSRITKLESSISALRNDLNEVIAKEEELKSGIGRASDDINLLKEEVKEWKSKSEECEKDIQEWKKKISNATTSISKLNRQLKSKETQIEQLNSQKQEILEKCELGGIILPTISDPMDTGSSTPNPVLDFSQLSRSHLQNTRSSQREKLDMEFTQKIGALTSEIERTAPNLKALDQYEALLEKERGVTEEFEAARKEDKEIADKYNSVKQRRYELFMEAFNHISGTIDKIYKQLTKSNTHQLGGTAYLNLDNEDEPFLHGIKYTAMPPTKRFRDMEQLSGGEKTVAALALLFSIHSYRPSPFFILDEVDAALDNLNVAKVAGFIRSKSCDGAWGNQDVEGGSGFQSIVISLKDTFYDKAEALVGVYRDSEMSCSRTLTFDLTKYRES